MGASFFDESVQAVDRLTSSVDSERSGPGRRRSMFTSLRSYLLTGQKFIYEAEHRAEIACESWKIGREDHVCSGSTRSVVDDAVGVRRACIVTHLSREVLDELPTALSPSKILSPQNMRERSRERPAADKGGGVSGVDKVSTKEAGEPSDEFTYQKLAAAEQRTMGRLEKGEGTCFQARNGSKEGGTKGWMVCYQYPWRCYYCSS